MAVRAARQLDVSSELGQLTELKLPVPAARGPETSRSEAVLTGCQSRASSSVEAAAAHRRCHTVGTAGQTDSAEGPRPKREVILRPL